MNTFFIPILFSQNDLNSCKLITNEKDVFIVDSVQFSVYYCSNIDLSNEDCVDLIAEGYSNEVPQDGINVLCVLFIEAEKSIKDFNFMNLFDSRGSCKDKEKVKLIFVYDTNSGFNKSYFIESDLKLAYQLNLRKGIPKDR